MKKKQAILFLTNKTDNQVINEFENISRSSSPYGDAYMLFHKSEGKDPESMNMEALILFDDTIITQVNYFPLGFSLVPGNNHYPLLQFYLKNPNYDYYWCIEDDVRYSGNWEDFFASLNELESDFISSHIYTSAEQPDWYWWRALANPYTFIPFEERIRSFNPIYRISHAAIEFIHRALLNGWCGHHEVLFPTLLFNGGFDLVDFGGDGSFVIPGNENKYYIGSQSHDLNTGTMRYRPIFNFVGEIKNKLYHPVK